jgi:hypothetical protein
MMILAALQKHIQAQEIMEDAIVSLHEIAYTLGDDTSDSAVLDSLRSARAVNVVLSAIQVDIKNSVTVEIGLALLTRLVRDSWDHELLFNNAGCCGSGYDVIAQVMKDFPLGCLGGHHCQNCGQQSVHYNAAHLLGCIAKHPHLRVNIVGSDCGVELANCLKKVSTCGPVKSPLEWFLHIRQGYVARSDGT